MYVHVSVSLYVCMRVCLRAHALFQERERAAGNQAAVAVVQQILLSVPLLLGSQWGRVGGCIGWEGVKGEGVTSVLLNLS